MLIAKASDGTKRSPLFSGEEGGLCPMCDEGVIAKVGDIVRPYWAHRAGMTEKSCDPWFGGETEWHLDWKSEALATGLYDVEVPLTYDGERHRADARTLDARVVMEFQHSSMRTDEMNRRTDFWSQHGAVVWVLDGKVSGWRRRFYGWYKRRPDQRPRGTLVLDEGADGRLWVWRDGASKMFPVDAPDAMLVELSRPRVVQRQIILNLRPDSTHRREDEAAVIPSPRARAGSPGTTGTTGMTGTTGAISSSHPSYTSHTLSIDVYDSHSKSSGMTERTAPVIPNPYGPDSHSKSSGMTGPDQPCGDPWQDGQRVWSAGQPSLTRRCRSCGLEWEDDRVG